MAQTIRFGMPLAYRGLSPQHSPEKEAAPGDATASRSFLIYSNVAAHNSDDRRSSDDLSDPLPPPPVSLPLAGEDDPSGPSIHRLIARPSSPRTASRVTAHRQVAPTCQLARCGAGPAHLSLAQHSPLNSPASPRFEFK